MFRTLLLSLTLLVTCAFIFAAEKSQDLSPVMCKRGKLLFEESFTDAALPKGWNKYKGNYQIADGVLKSQEIATDGHHPAMSRKLGAKNVIVQCSFRFDGAKWLGLSFDGKEHVARCMVTPTGFRVVKMSGMGKTTKGENLGEKKIKFELGKFYTLLLEIHGGEMLARLDDQTFAYGEGAGVEQDKTRFELISGGDWCAYDDLKVWEAEPNPDWPATKAKLVAIVAAEKAKDPKKKN